MRAHTPKHRPTPRYLALAFVPAVFLALPAPAQPAYSDIAVFGDSLSDVGNTHNDGFISFFSPVAEPPYFDGRFSNGPVWAELLADRLGLFASNYSDNGGNNYASGGALAGDGTNFFGFIDNVGRQVDNYLGANTPGPSDLHLIWGGGNDFIEIGGSLGAFFSGGGTPQGVADDLAAHLEQLAQAGAQHILILNMPDLGAIPRYAGTSQQQALTNTSTQFNALLAGEVDALNAQYAVDIDLLDIQALFDQMLDDPTRYGFTNTTTPAHDEDAGTVVADPNSHVFWDEIHPTTRAHAWIAEAAYVALRVEGDFTGDGLVNVDDLDLLLANWGDTVTPFDLTRGDWTGDGVVDGDDLDRVLGNWGAGAPPEVAVPEPGVLALLLPAWWVAVRRQRGHV